MKDQTAQLIIASKPVEVNCPNDEFENAIRKYGIISACEWFGHEITSKFTQSTIDVLAERSKQ